MKKLFFNEKAMIIVLGATSPIMIISCLFGSKSTAIGLASWFSIIVWIMYLLIRGRFVQSIEYHEKDIQKAKKEGKYLQYGVKSVAIPMCAVGIIVVIANLVVMFFK